MTRGLGGTPSGNSEIKTVGFGTEEKKENAELAAIQLAAASKAQIEAHFIMAIKRPRNEALSRARLMDRCKDPVFADAAIYSKPIGGDSIEGLSIRFVEDLIAVWGNIKVKTQVTYEDDFRRVVNVNVIDLETNTSYETDISIEKTVERRKAGPDREIINERVNTRGERVFILRATEDEVNIKTAAGISKAIRNNGLRCIPGSLKEECLKIMNEVLQGKIKENPEAERRKIIDGFNGIGIKPDEIEKYLEHKIDLTTPAELAELRKIYNALKAGETNWLEVMQSKSEKDPEGKGRKQQEAAAGALSDLVEGDGASHRAVDRKLDTNKK